MAGEGRRVLPHTYTKQQHQGNLTSDYNGSNSLMQWPPLDLGVANKQNRQGKTHTLSNPHQHTTSWSTTCRSKAQYGGQHINIHDTPDNKGIMPQYKAQQYCTQAAPVQSCSHKPTLFKLPPSSSVDRQADTCVALYKQNHPLSQV